MPGGYMNKRRRLHRSKRMNALALKIFLVIKSVRNPEIRWKPEARIGLNGLARRRKIGQMPLNGEPGKSIGRLTRMHVKNDVTGPHLRRPSDLAANAHSLL